MAFDKEAIAAEIRKQSEESGNDSDVEAKAAARMEALGFDPKADEVVPEDEPVPAEDLEDVDDKEDDDLESDDEEDDDSTPEDEDEEPADTDEEEGATDEEAQEDDEQKDGPQLSDAYYRAAIHSGMSDGDIANFMKVDPESALKTFGSLYETMNRSSQEFADLGRYKKEHADDKVATEDKPSFRKIDTTSMRAELGDEVADQFDAQQEQMAEVFNRQQQAAPVVNSDDQDLIDERTKNATQQIEAFFNTADMAKYEQTYGITEKGDTEWVSLMPNAQMNRIAVIDSAEQLIEGAAQLGREMSIDDALERAHLLVTQPIRDKIIRDDIMGKVVKRSKGITLKPSSKVADAVVKPKGPKTAAEVEDNAATRLAKMFGNS